MSGTPKTVPDYAARLAAMRFLVGVFSAVYLLVQARAYAYFGPLAARFDPVGLAAVLDAPLPAALAGGLYAACVACAVPFALGYRFNLFGPLFGMLLLWVASYRSSFGMVFHSDNLLCMHALMIGLSPAAAVFARDARGAPGSATASAARLALLFCAAITAATYVLAGVAKLKLSGMHWMEGDILRNYIAYDALRKIQAGSIHSPLGVLLVQHAWPFPIIGILTMVVELGAPLSFLHRRLAVAFTVAILAFHWGVLAVMAIAFVYPLSGIPYLTLLPAERVFRWKLARRLVGAT